MINSSTAPNVRAFFASDVRSAIVIGLVLVAIANGLSIRVYANVLQYGVVTSIINTFGVSVIVWFSIANFWELSREANFGKALNADWVVIALVACLICVPLSSASWLGLTLLTIYFLCKQDLGETTRRALWVALAVGLSQQWSRWVSTIFLPTILDVDAFLVSGLSGFPRYGNLVVTDNGITLQILEACSSFSNVSLAFLGWINARSYFGTRGVWRAFKYLSLAIAAVVSVNTVRIAAIAFWPDMFDIIHGEIGSAIASLASTILISIICIKGARK